MQMRLFKLLCRVGKVFFLPTFILILAFIFSTSIGQTQDMSMELDPLEVRPSLVTPRLSLPTNLTTVPVVNPGEYFVPPLESKASALGNLREPYQS